MRALAHSSKWAAISDVALSDEQTSPPVATRRNPEPPARMTGLRSSTRPARPDEPNFGTVAWRPVPSGLRG